MTHRVRLECDPDIPVAPGEGHLDEVYFALQLLESNRQLSLAFTFHLHALEKEMATHSSVLAWRIPGTGKRGGLPSMGSHRVGHD